MKFLFRLGAILKILFLLNIFFIEKYEDWLFRNNTNTHLFDGLELNIELPWYFYLFAIVVTVGYLLNLIIINLFCFRPCWKFSKFFHRLNPARWLYSFGIILFITEIVLGYIKFDDAFATRDYGIWGVLLKPLINTEEANNMHLIDKLNAFNFMLPAIASLMILVTFWQVRKINQAKCLEEQDNPT